MGHRSRQRKVDEICTGPKRVVQTEDKLPACNSSPRGSVYLRDFIFMQLIFPLNMLDQTQWKVSEKNSAAEILGLNSSTLRARIRKFNIRKP